ncbi:MAG: peroxide stress protein YaaA [Gammaproteobacteria bacterium]|nr:peroxide stress protein YaaA [Gammaproteobacteria bacterium]
MLAILSPAKSLDFESRLPPSRHTMPDFLEDSAQLVGRLREFSPQDLSELMGISDKLAQLNADRYAAWKAPFNRRNARPAVLAFNGDAYQGLRAHEFSGRDLGWAQRHLRILSGLHGVLRPLDLIQPYRLEMSTPLGTPAGSSLYDFWDERLTGTIREAVQASGTPVLVNLASKEYFSAVDLAALEARVITPRFLDFRSGQYRFVSFLGKRARGMMARFIIERRLCFAKGLLEFSEAGYRYDPERSTRDQPAFIRDPV